jgi:hypothetical protein
VVLVFGPLLVLLPLLAYKCMLARVFALVCNQGLSSLRSADNSKVSRQQVRFAALDNSGRSQLGGRGCKFEALRTVVWLVNC